MVTIIRKNVTPPIERIEFNSIGIVGNNTCSIHRSSNHPQNYVIDLCRYSVTITSEELAGLAVSLRILVDEDNSRRNI